MNSYSRGWTRVAVAMAVGVICTALARDAAALVLLPGQLGVPTAMTLPAGVVVGSSTGGGGSFSNGAFTQTITEQVFREAATGNLDFIYQVTNVTPTVGISTFGAGGFSGLSIDAGYIAGTGVAPSLVSYPGAFFSFGFSPFIFGLQASTAQLVVRTNAANFVAGTPSLGLPNEWVPLAPAATGVPEPSTAALGLLGLPGLGWWMLKKRKTR